jgi:hypothetical protein
VVQGRGLRQVPTAIADMHLAFFTFDMMVSLWDLNTFIQIRYPTFIMVPSLKASSYVPFHIVNMMVGLPSLQYELMGCVPEKAWRPWRR